MAQTAGIINSTMGGLYIGAAKVTHLTNVSLDVSMETRDTTTKDSAGYAEKLEGLRSWSGSADAFFAEDATYGEADIITLWAARTPVVIKVLSSEVVGDSRFTGTAYITGYSKSGGVEDNITYSLTLEGTGVLTREVIV